MKVIAISGKAGSGKTTLANKLHKNLESNGEITSIFKFAKPLYTLQDEIQVMLKKPRVKDRGILIGVGEMLKKVYGETVFTETMINDLKVEQELDYNKFIIIDDMRFGHELEALYGSGLDVITIRLDAPVSILDKRVGVPADRDHITETDLDNAMFDLYIDVNNKDQREVLNEVIANL